MHYDAQDINADGNTMTWEPVNGSNISSWQDAANSFSWSQYIISQQTLYQTGAINNELPGLLFDGSNDILEIRDEIEINLAESFSWKTLAVVIETWTNINTLQTIYEQGTHEKWYSFQISGWRLYGWVWNTLDWSPWNEYQIIDYGVILANESYYVTLVHDSINVRWYLDGILSTTLTTADIQSIHGICRFDTFFGCSLYSTGGTIGIGGTQNDTLNLSNENVIQTYQWNHFSGHIWELISWNRPLSSGEVSILQTYFLNRWEPDTIEPTITWFSPNSNFLLPIWNFTIEMYYEDNIWGSGINSSSWSIILQKWNSIWLNYDPDISSTYLSSSIITSGTGSFDYSGVLYGKYRATFEISDNAWNTSSQSVEFYIDEVEMIVSTGSLDMWSIDSSGPYFSDELTVTVRTLWAAHDVTLNYNTDLSYQTESIPQFTTLWYWYDLGPTYSNTITDISSQTSIWSQVVNINTNGEKNTYTYRVKIWALVDIQQAAGDYEWSIDIWIELGY